MAASTSRPPTCETSRSRSAAIAPISMRKRDECALEQPDEQRIDRFESKVPSNDADREAQKEERDAAPADDLRDRIGPTAIP